MGKRRVSRVQHTQRSFTAVMQEEHECVTTHPQVTASALSMCSQLYNYIVASHLNMLQLRKLHVVCAMSTAGLHMCHYITPHTGGKPNLLWASLSSAKVLMRTPRRAVVSAYTSRGQTQQIYRSSLMPALGLVHHATDTNLAARCAADRMTCFAAQPVHTTRR